MMLGRPNDRDASPRSGLPDLGFRHLAAVRVWTGDGPDRFEVDGIVRRHPVTRPVTASLAARLVAHGVPLVIRGSTTGDGPC